MLELLFGNQNTERVLFYILKREDCYGQSLAVTFDSSLYGFQCTLRKLEKANILVSFKRGNIRFYQFNPQYPFLTELKAFLEKAYTFLPDKHKDYYEPLERKRPRKMGKLL